MKPQNPSISEYEITCPLPGTCEFCGELVEGRVLFALYGGCLWVCEACFQALRNCRSKPYSQVMDKYAITACGYYVNRKFARIYGGRRCTR